MRRMRSAERGARNGLIAPRMSLVRRWYREGWLTASIAEGKLGLAGFERGSRKPVFSLTRQQQEELARARNLAAAAWATLSRNVNERRAP